MRDKLMKKIGEKEERTKEVAIKVENLSKTFKVPHEKHSTLKKAAFKMFSHKSYEEFSALKNINFEVKEGEFFGIIGRNGSGKSTLLKILAGIYIPDSKGQVAVNGKLSPFLELGVGFNFELTGRENIFLGGSILGLSKKEIEEKFDKIVSFAELEEFIDMKLKNYSSGMQVRLAFALSINAHADILLMDEVLAVGDSSFQRKCFDYFKTLKKEKRTVILVSHDMGSIRRFCDRVILIEKGKIIKTGDVQNVTAKYDMLNKPKTEGIDQKSKDSIYHIDKVKIKNDQKNVEIVTSYKTKAKRFNNKPAIVGVSLLSDKGAYILGFNNLEYIGDTVITDNIFKATCEIPCSQFLTGHYLVNISLYNEGFSLLDHKNYATSFSIIREEDLSRDGFFNVNLRWKK